MQNWLEEDPTSKSIAENLMRTKRLINDSIQKDSINNDSDLNLVINKGLELFAKTTMLRVVGCLDQFFESGYSAPRRQIAKKIKRHVKDEINKNYITKDEFFKLFTLATETLSQLPKYNTFDEMRAFLNIFIVCGLTSIRVSDSKRINQNQLLKLYEDGFIIINAQKTQRDNRIVLNPHNKPWLKIVLENYADPKLKEQVNVYKLFKQHYEKSLGKTKPKGLGFHSLRFYYAYSSLGMMENKLEQTQSQMGHATTKQTNYYVNRYAQNELL